MRFRALCLSPTVMSIPTNSERNARSSRGRGTTSSRPVLPAPALADEDRARPGARVVRQRPVAEVPTVGAILGGARGGPGRERTAPCSGLVP